MKISRIKNRISEAATEACGYSPLTKVVSEEEINRILEQESGWIPVDEQIPNTDKYILVSFENFTIPDIGRYETDEDGKQQSCFYIVRSLMTFKLRQFALMHGIKTACCRGDTTFKNSAGKETIWNF